MIRSFLIASFLLAPITTYAMDKLVIISPHRRSIQNEYIPAFKEYYKKKYKKEVKVEWLDQGGTSDDLKFIRAKFASSKKSSGIDVFWGGGASAFVELDHGKYLSKYELPKTLKSEIPQEAAGVALYTKSKNWYASAISSFGIFYGKKALQFEKLPEPKSWEDLAQPKFYNQLSLADPRRSGSATIMNVIVVEALGWDKGWEILTSIAGNTRKFTHSSSDPIKAVVSGDASAAMAIDFYANAKIGDLGKDNLGFALPEGKTVMDPDPIAILKGAPNRRTAERFVNFVLSSEAQRLLFLPKGSAGGPKMSTLGRMAINKAAYNGIKGEYSNPFDIKSTLKLNNEKMAQTQRVFIDLLGAVHIDTHKELKKAWKNIKDKNDPKLLAEFSKMPISEKELLQLSKKWNDNVFRNKTINDWIEFSRKKYKKIATL